MICTDLDATGIDDCREFRFADVNVVQNSGSIVEVDCHAAHTFQAEQLASWSSFKKALKTDLPGFHRDLDTFKRDVKISGDFAIFPVISPADNNPSPVLLPLLAVTVPVGVASLPVSAVGGSVDSMVTAIKLTRYLKSIVQNDRTVIERFNNAHMSGSMMA